MQMQLFLNSVYSFQFILVQTHIRKKDLLSLSCFCHLTKVILSPVGMPFIWLFGPWISTWGCPKQEHQPQLRGVCSVLLSHLYPAWTLTPHTGSAPCKEEPFSVFDASLSTLSWRTQLPPPLCWSSEADIRAQAVFQRWYLPVPTSVIFHLHLFLSPPSFYCSIPPKASGLSCF